MSVSTHLERAESALRKALINALAEGEDHLLTDLFDNLTNIIELNKKSKNIIRFSDKVDEYYHNKDNNLSFDLTEPDLSALDFSGLESTRNGSDLDSLDSVIQFPNFTFNDDIISFTPDPEFESRMNPEEE
tara:strand:+ start:94 stop:486 length:393 start_codon:yes stop_codon:yes gene_type:complete